MRPPGEQLAGRQSIMRNHSGYPGFSCWIALEDGARVGFAYGFHGAPGQWWHDVVRRGLAEVGGEAAAREWFADPFEIAEIHVLPEYQGRGLGRRLLHRLTGDRTERTALLSTHDRLSAARHLYRDLGFVDLLSDFEFPGGTESYAIMGARLPLAVQPSSRR
ncbi:N-acetyltransferase [Bailinhaonella thermotolerans]|uniref:N-acetyltransferase n=2 Tax=Bailinhaonella thermotolerans TaxID=1070861 RepID=A0A3A4AP82_9ACTN|nr:N-acetyltransferase [Bailinhaonella thermotolerans]